MWSDSAMWKVEANDTVTLFNREKNKKHIINLAVTRGKYSTDKGVIDLDSLIGKEYGRIVETHLGYPYLLLPTTMYDFIMKKLNRLTQIVYPKDAAYILMRLDVKPGDTVVECGLGSGSMTAVFARFVGETGRVISYEKREEFVKNAISNLNKIGLRKRVTIKQKDIADGFDEKDADSLFLDVREPWLYIKSALNTLRVGGMLGVLVPTVNQVEESLRSLENENIIDLEVSEILLRKYKPVADRLRPEDRMSAHTAYMMFARKVR